ncbi:hypothetical protein JZ751_010884 [Albula glossodonta]|uniref:Uncharacterized protein n=1 Tax=Albula glossodonta TaxID=121402 RepID=A0A8T2NV44_9TELE|nr:hypothetical protein JZ751_010884 [Albula glossodonta]
MVWRRIVGQSAGFLPSVGTACILSHHTTDSETILLNKMLATGRGSGVEGVGGLETGENRALQVLKGNEVLRVHLAAQAQPGAKVSGEMEGQWDSRGLQVHLQDHHVGEGKRQISERYAGPAALVTTPMRQDMDQAKAGTHGFGPILPGCKVIMRLTKDWLLGLPGPTLPAQHVIEVCKRVVMEQMSTFANSVKRTCAAVCPLYGDVPMGAPGPPGQKGPPGPPPSKMLTYCVVLRGKRRKAEVFGSVGWNENIQSFHIPASTNRSLSVSLKKDRSGDGMGVEGMGGEERRREQKKGQERRAVAQHTVVQGILGQMVWTERSDSRDSMVRQVTQEGKEHQVIKENKGTRELKAMAYLATWETKGPRVNEEDQEELLMDNLVVRVSGVMWAGLGCQVTRDCLGCLVSA